MRNFSQIEIFSVELLPVSSGVLAMALIALAVILVRLNFMGSSFAIVGTLFTTVFFVHANGNSFFAVPIVTAVFSLFILLSVLCMGILLLFIDRAKKFFYYSAGVSAVLLAIGLCVV